MSEPLVSVHMITYNHALYIAKAIECVLAQKTDFPFELVIGEDCSTDGTREIVFDYAKRYPEIIQIVTSEKNVGAKKNGARTFVACRGKYIAYCEGDDFWHRDDKLQIQADYMENHPECGLVYSDHDRFFVKNGRTIKRFYHTTNNLPPNQLNVFEGWGPGLNILTCTVMATKALLSRLFADPYLYDGDHYIGGTDIVFSEIALVSKIHYINESLATYRLQVESASNKKNPVEMLKFSISGYNGNIYNAKKYNCYEDIPYLERRRDRAILWLAFYESNALLAKQVKRNSATFSLKEWLLYLGAVNQVARYLVYPFAIGTRKMKLYKYNFLLFCNQK